MDERKKNRLSVDGKFFSIDGKRNWIKCVCYGPFPDPQPDAFSEFKRIKQAGFNSIRVYESPSPALLEAAVANDLLLFVGISWQWHRVFTGAEANSFWHEASIEAIYQLNQWGEHPAVAAIYIANEIPSDIARWIGPTETRKALDSLIEIIRKKFPHLLLGYANYPSSSYLEPALADFTALNLYLEDKKKLTSYLDHAHHMAGDRPLLISETGLDSMRNGTEAQKEALAWQLQLIRAAGCAGATIFSWSDRWRRGNLTVDDWQFGLTDETGHDKPALKALSGEIKKPTLSRYPMFSIIICVHNGADRVAPCLKVIEQLNYPCYEVIVVDDGSKDSITDLLANYPNIRFLQQSHAGLSAARNLGAQHARGDIFAYTDDDCIPDADWLYWLAKAYDDNHYDLCGGPNLPPTPLDADEAIVAAAPGAPTHVMLSDTTAEHIPGCNLTITRSAFEQLGGFNTRYWVAGDDVDFCWRAETLGLKIGFHGAAFVWHRRRSTFLKYLKQQIGYGKAEALLELDHPDKFDQHGHSIWKGVVYQGGPQSATRELTIYSGPMGDDPFQFLIGKVMPIRPLHRKFKSPATVRKLKLAHALHPYIRAYARIKHSSRKFKLLLYPKAILRIYLNSKQSNKPLRYSETKSEISQEISRHHYLQSKLTDGWQQLPNDPNWDLVHANGQKLLVCEDQLGDGFKQLRIRTSH